MIASLGKGAASAWGSSPFAAEFLCTAPSGVQRDRSIGERVVVFGLLLDTVVILAAMVLSFWLRFHTRIGGYGIVANVSFRDYAGYVAVGAVSMVLTLAYRQVYERSVMLRYRRVARQIFESSVMWVLGFLSISLILKFQPPVSRLYVAIAGANILAGLLFARWLFDRFVHRSNVVECLRQRVLFVGWNEDAERLATAFGSDQAGAYELVGCVSPANRDFVREPVDQRLVLGSQEDIAGIVESRSIDIVMLADMNAGQSEVFSLANLCEKKMIQFKVIPSYFQILVSGLHLETVSGIPILGVSRLPLDRCFNICVKRVVDVVGACVGLLVLPPLLAIFGALIYLESPGPILFRQERRGRNGRPFWMYKIRSMKFGAEKLDHLSQSTGRQDPRLLKVGAFLRRWNLDEVPQFWNVLKGEMSLVGPRPERTFHSEKLSNEIPHYNARHNVKPGITGWAQVKGLRGDTDLCERVKCDLFYLENWSLLLDFQIMVMTFLRRENAY
jgi:exopolysaccharide biosynthesis polyprenyl glycosylphosphotransferase